MSASKSADRHTPEAAELLDLLAELRLLRFLFGAVTASHDELREKVRVLAKAKHVVLFDGSEEPAPKVVTHCTWVSSWRSSLRGFCVRTAGEQRRHEATLRRS